MKKMFAIFFFSVCSLMIFAQQKGNSVAFKTITTDADLDKVFDKTIDYLEENGYFILSLDKKAGFVQAKVFIENKKILSAKAGERRTLNFLIRPTKDARTKVSLNIYIEEQYWGADSTKAIYYYREKGISEDSSIYNEILNGLLKEISKE